MYQHSYPELKEEKAIGAFVRLLSDRLAGDKGGMFIVLRDNLERLQGTNPDGTMLLELKRFFTTQVLDPCTQP